MCGHSPDDRSIRQQAVQAKLPKRKEVNAMKYAKPEVVPICSAVAAIRMINPPGSKAGTTISDHEGLDHYVTNPAYEADE
jgi:hypothetical protein